MADEELQPALARRRVVYHNPPRSLGNTSSTDQATDSSTMELMSVASGAPGAPQYGFQGLEPIFSNFREVFLHSDFPGLVQQISDIRANTFVNFQPTQTFGPVRPHQILRSQETEAPGTALTSSFNFTSLTDGLLRLTADAMPFNFELWDFAQGPLAPTDDRLQQSFHATTFRPLPLLHNEPPIQLSAIEDLLLPDDDLTLQGSASAGASSDTLFDNYRSDDSSDMVLDLDDIPYDEADANQHQRRMEYLHVTADGVPIEVEHLPQLFRDPGSPGVQEAIEQFVWEQRQIDPTYGQAFLNL